MFLSGEQEDGESASAKVTSGRRLSAGKFALSRKDRGLYKNSPTAPDSPAVKLSPSATTPPLRGFTLVEMLVVIGIISILLVAVIPAFNTRKTADDFNNAIYTLKGTFEVARTYAQSNNTYTWIGLYEENGAISSTTPATPGVGRLIVFTVASKSGLAPTATGSLDPTNLRAVGKLIKIDNLHLPILAVGTGTGDKFDTRPLPDYNTFNGYISSTFGEINAGASSAPPTNTSYPFQYPIGSVGSAVQYNFVKTMQFSPRGEGKINCTYDLRRVVELGLVPTHQNVAPSPSPTAGQYAGNAAAIQISGLASTVKVYRR